jgi:ketosteroid isomerase-like protein
MDIMRRLVTGIALVIFGISGMLVACSGSNTPSDGEQRQQRLADMYQIDQIEKQFHEATTKKDIEEMVSLFAPNATMTVGDSDTATGLAEIREFFLTKSAAFTTDVEWISDHPAYKLEITVNGDRGTLHFECHYIDAKTGVVAAVTAADFDVARIDGAWLITNMIGGTTVLEA